MGFDFKKLFKGELLKTIQLNLTAWLVVKVVSQIDKSDVAEKLGVKLVDLAEDHLPEKTVGQLRVIVAEVMFDVIKGAFHPTEVYKKELSDFVADKFQKHGGK